MKKKTKRKLRAVPAHQPAQGEARQESSSPSVALPETNLVAWLTDARMDMYHGRAYVLRNEVLALVITGRGNLAEIARRHHLSRAALTRHAARAKAIWCVNGKLTSPIL